MAWSVPTLWKHLVFLLDPEQDGELESSESLDLRVGLLNESISRSISLPLTLEICTTDGGFCNVDEDLFQALADILLQPEVICRLYDLGLNVSYAFLSRFHDVRAPNLKKLTLKASALEVDDYSEEEFSLVNLLPFTLKVMELDIQMQMLQPSQFSCEQLLSFKAHYYHLTAAIKTMQKSRNLRSCIIDSLIEDDFSSSVDQVTISLPHLESLVISGDSSIDHFLRLLSFPALESIEISCFHQISPQIVNSLIERSRCSLKELYLYGMSGSRWMPPDIDRLLDIAPTLKTFYLECPIAVLSLAKVFHTIFPSSISSSPRASIERVFCSWKWSSNICADDGFWDFIPEIFGHRIDDATINYRTQTAKTIEMQLYSLPQQKNVRDFLIPRRGMEVIQDLKNKGWKWEVKAMIGRRYIDLIQESMNPQLNSDS